ncbi:MAG: glucosamine-6-phosphate deaminase [Ignavibacteriae bacterium]|nr:glucosamine-6-phosphate deaminase [Ignavibacteriota bacterium]MCB9209895.1 glucosamine-6-phosphate deaminase [Ignavibacteriales bacterium]MCB9260277.1 glucosamine-6-phosphate deaminase [Ignavibacteriales bacterium]
MLVIVKSNYDKLSEEAAKVVADRLKKKPNLVLGLATGSTPLGLYKELIRLHKYEGLDFSKVTTFNLDEYVGLPPSHDQSYHYFMQKNFFDEINIDPRYIHVPHGMAKDFKIFCSWYEERIKSFGGIDIQVLGIGANGHIAFNEPGSSLGSRTRIKTLTSTTRADNKRFFENEEDVPKYAITMGVGTIMDAKELLLVASGDSKAEAIKSAVEGPLTAMCPASIIQMHKEAFVIIDKPAASKLKGTYVDTWETIIFE